MRIGFLGSGDLGYHALSFLKNYHAIEFVLTNKKSISIKEIANEIDAPLFTGNPRNEKATHFIADKFPEVVLSVNYLFIIEQDIIDLPSHYSFNIHGSLLPKYRGRAPHIWAIINNENETGITVHQIDAGCDTGDIVFQEHVSIDNRMTGADLLGIFEKRYPVILNEVLNKTKNETLTFRKQDHSLATHFGKRKPEDGLINWNWQRERIYNWVRALAKPYPGAFTYFNEEPFTIHSIKFSNLGFDFQDANGKILQICDNNPIVKTPNGAIEITDAEWSGSSEIKPGAIFG